MTKTVEPITPLTSEQRMHMKAFANIVQANPGAYSEHHCSTANAIQLYEAALSAAEEEIADLKVAKILEMNNDQVVALLGDHDASMRSAIERHALQEENSTLRTELYVASQALEEAAVDLGLCDARPAKKRTAKAFHRARNALNDGKNDV